MPVIVTRDYYRYKERIMNLRRFRSGIIVLVLLVLSAGCVTSKTGGLPEKPAPDFYFAQITDTHLDDGDHADRLETIVDRINAFPRPLACVVVTGDLFMHIENQEARDRLLKIMGRLKVPVHYLPGNHDIEPPDEQNKAEIFKSVFGPIWSTAEYQNVLFVFTFMNPAAEGYSVDGVNPMQWTRHALEAAGDRPALVFDHTPPVEDFYGNEFHEGWPPEVLTPWTELLNAHNVKAVVNGHFHRDEGYWLGSVPGYTGPAVAGYWGNRASYRFYRYRDGHLDYYTQNAEPKPRARGIFSEARASTEGSENSALAAIDGQAGTRWESAHQADPQWLEVTLKEPRTIREITIDWETASAREYDVQLSADGSEWTTVAAVTDGAPDEERTLTFDPVTARHIRIVGKKRATEWGYSIWEIRVP